jgi:hypothetical protein
MNLKPEMLRTKLRDVVPEIDEREKDLKSLSLKKKKTSIANDNVEVDQTLVSYNAKSSSVIPTERKMRLFSP